MALVVLASLAALLSQVGRSRTAPSIDSYKGLASWVDVYDTRAWADPERAVTDMASHGVRTVFVQTGNSNSAGALFDSSAQARFIRSAHAHKMKVVAWYLPDLTDVQRDCDRISRAVKFRTTDGQRFDSFSLDIESTALPDESARNQALDDLTQRLRRLVGPSYALGAIIPSPVSLAKKAGFWDAFPYQSIAKAYDVVLPMGYYTLDGTGAAAARAETLANTKLLRAQPGCATVPVHMIGGLAEKSTAAEVRAFATAVSDSACIGGSLYSWTGTTGADWGALRGIPGE